MRYHNITKDDMLNGDGLRVVVWLSACSHNCIGCHNPQTHDPFSGIEFDAKAKEEIFAELDKPYISGITFSGGDPLHENNLDGVLDLINDIRINYPFETQEIDTIPQHIVVNKNSNHNILTENHDEIHVSSTMKTAWLYTGFTWDQIMCPIVTDDLNPIRDSILQKRKEIVSKCDVLIDGRYVENLRDVSLKWIGSSNQRVIDVKESLKQNKIILFET